MDGQAGSLIYGHASVAPNDPWISYASLLAVIVLILAEASHGLLPAGFRATIHSIMRRIRIVLILLFVGLLVTGYITLRALGFFGASAGARAKAVPKGDQEIAYIQAATSGSSWERFVSGIRHLRDEFPDLEIDEASAFPDQTAAVPEIGLGFKGCPSKLWIRWYKMTSEAGIRDWVAELARRNPAPLAITGTGSSDRARDLAEALTAQKDWHGQPPLLLLTTATADEIYRHDEATGRPIPLALMSLYPGRTFRFCFSNRQMAEGVRDFVWSHPYVWAIDSSLPSLAGAATAAGGDVWGSLSPFALGARLQLPDVRVLEWSDDPYSTDLSAQFREVLNTPGHEANSVASYTLLYSVGGYYRPNPSEAAGIKKLVDQMLYAPDQRHLLVLPAVEKPARRILRGLAATAPAEVRNIVAVTGDSISFNIIYRDRDIAWNIQDMPVPLVFFCHQNPVAWAEDPGKPKSRSRAASATDDMLLNADIGRVLLEAFFTDCPKKRQPGTPTPTLVANADELATRLHKARRQDGQAPFFSADGNRRGGSGEYVVCLLPHFEGGRVLPSATIKVLSRQGGGRWQLVRILDVDYADSPRGGGNLAEF